MKELLDKDNILLIQENQYPNKWGLRIILGLMGICLILQVDDLLWLIFYQVPFAETGIINCFFSFPTSRPYVQLICILTLLISIFFFYKNKWQAPKNSISKLALLSPIFVLILDQALGIFANQYWGLF